jgi:predicted phage tail protein
MGPIYGLVNGLNSIELNDTPIQNADGSLNFANVSVDYRLGTYDQTFMAGFPSTESEIGVGVALDSDTPIVRSIEDTQLTAIRVRFTLPSLQQQNMTTGEVTGYKIDYAIDIATDGGPYVTVLANSFNGKRSSPYQRTERIDLPAAKQQWLIRIRRLTPNAHVSNIQDVVNVDAITQIIDRKFRYPGVALIGLQFDAKTFQNEPTRAYRIRGRIIAVPTNYDPQTRTYNGVWDGTFKQAYCNNPAWVLLDMASNRIYGAGKFIDANALDKWALYDIAQYCDVMVPDGKGGFEPRFTCNCVIQSQSDAFKVLQDIASVFRGKTYWGNGNVFATIDAPMDPVYVYTNANVINGEFKYGSTERKTRYTAASVSWNNPDLQYKQDVAYVPDDDGQKRYGLIKASLTAFGCTSEGQAVRMGKWALVSSRLEIGNVTFDVGLDGTLSAPGDVIAIADSRKAGRRIGGRIRALKDNTATLDKMPTIKAGDSLTVILDTGRAEKHAVVSVAGNVVTVDAPWSSGGAVGAVWMLESVDLAAQLFRVTDIVEGTDNGKVTYTITAVQHEPGKFAYIDNGAAIPARPITVTPPKAQAAPTNVRITTSIVIDQGIAKTNMTIAWDEAANAVDYIPEWRKDNGDWVPANVTYNTEVDVLGIYTGTYEARVSARNAMGVTSLPTVSAEYSLQGKTGKPPSVAFLTASTDKIFAIDINWGFPADHTADDTAVTQIWYSATPDLGAATQYTQIAYPGTQASMLGLAAGRSFFFWARLIDRSGNIGDFSPVGAGVNGQSSSSADAILELLTGQITKSQLGQDLLGPIQSIEDVLASVGAVADITAKLSAEEIARSDADTTLAQDIRTLNARLHTQLMGDDGTPFGDATLYAGVISEEEARTDADGALADKITGVAAQLDSAAENLSALVEQEMQARTSADEAFSQQLTNLESTVNDTIAAKITEVETAIATLDQSTTEKITQLESTVNDTITSQIADINKTIATNEEATATSIQQLQTQAGENSAAIQVQAQSYANLQGQVNASYTVKVQSTANGQTYAAGFALGLDGSTSSFIVSANTFAIIDPASGAKIAPFIVRGSQVFINEAFITNLSVDFARVNGDLISTAVGANGQPMWALRRTGGIEINTPWNAAVGGYMTLSGTLICVYDNAARLRIRMGAWQ